MFNLVKDFESAIADFFGSPYAIATDSCTHAIELCLRLTQADQVTCPSQTYISVPFTFIKCGCEWKFEDYDWQEYYQIGNTNIFDAATYWKPNGYIKDTLMCISFQNKKHLKLGRGGIILCDNKQHYNVLCKMVYDGRDILRPWREENIEIIGYHYYMTPETAELGLQKLDQAVSNPATIVYSNEYPYLPNMKVFQQNVSN